MGLKPLGLKNQSKQPLYCVFVYITVLSLNIFEAFNICLKHLSFRKFLKFKNALYINAFPVSCLDLRILLNAQEQQWVILFYSPYPFASIYESPEVHIDVLPNIIKFGIE